MAGRWWINAVLLVACVLLWRLASQPLDTAPGLAELAGLAPETVTRVTIRQRGNPPLEFAADSGGWLLRAPVQGRVSDVMRERLAALLRAPASLAFSLDSAHSAETAEAHSRTLADLGLDEPWLVIELNGLPLRVGAAEPVERRRYVQAGADILLLDDRWLLPLLAPPEDILAPAHALGSLDAGTP